MLKRAGSATVSVSPPTVKSGTAVELKIAEASVWEVSDLLSGPKEEGAAVYSPASEKAFTNSDQNAQTIGFSTQGVKRPASPTIDDVPQGGGLPRTKRMCASDFLDKEIDKDNLP
jgi:hypothetical protein